MDANFIPFEESIAGKRTACENKTSDIGNHTQNFVARKPVYDPSRLVVSEAVREQLDVLRSRMTNHDLLYRQWGLCDIDPMGRHTAFNLYGPPGTGKTMCVEVLAAEWGMPIIDVNYAEIESKYVGDTGKNIVAAFAAAKEQNALLFFDEADSILGKRMTSVTQAADQAVNVARAVMLKQLDLFDGVVAFATNLARNFDSAFVRRIAVHIEIPLPDEKGRKEIAIRLTPDKLPFKDAISFDRLASSTEGFSGGDIRNVIVNAISILAMRNWKSMSKDEIAEEFLRQAEFVKKAKKSVGSTYDISENEEKEDCI